MERVWGHLEEKTGGLGEEQVVLAWKSLLPSFAETKRGWKRVQRYYEQVESQWLARWEGLVCQRAEEDCQRKQEEGAVFVPWQASLRGEVWELAPGLLSIGLTVEEKQGKGLWTQVFFGDLWKDGGPWDPLALLEEGWSKGGLLERAVEAGKQEEELCFYQGFPEKARANRKKLCFFWTKSGIEGVFPQETVAHGLEGVVRLPLGLAGAFSEDGEEEVS